MKECEEHWFLWDQECGDFCCVYCLEHLEKDRCEICGWPEKTPRVIHFRRAKGC